MQDASSFKLYSIVSAAAIVGLGAWNVWLLNARATPTSFEEITVERINVVEANGDLKLVLSNAARQHPGMMDREPWPDREREAGLIFFNSEQDEVGGLVYEGNSEDGASIVLSLDQYKNDQVMQLRYLEDRGSRSYGLQLWDRDPAFPLTRVIAEVDRLRAEGASDKHIGAQLRALNGDQPVSARRMFVGKNFEEQVGVFVNDSEGRARIRIYVDEQDEPHLEFLDDSGAVVGQMSAPRSSNE